MIKVKNEDMKKILLSIIMLCCMTMVAWAGTGSGSKFDPYTGEWDVSELGAKLKPGDCLAYDCILKGGNVTVYDSKLGTTQAVHNERDWAVGTTITPLGIYGNLTTNANYTEYRTYNIGFEVTKQSFIIDKVERKSTTEIAITGYFTGTYPTRQSDGYWHVGSTTGLEKVIEQDNGALIKLTDDIEISNLRGPFCDSFSGTIDGYYTDHIGDSTVYCSHSLYAGETIKEWVTDDKGEKKLKVKSRTRTECTYLFRELNHATIKNVVLSNISVDADDNDNIDEDQDELGVLARRAVNGCTFSNVTLDYCYVDCKESRGGIMLGYAEYCNFQLVNIKNSVIYVYELEGGGIVGHSDFCTYEMCVTSFDTGVWVDGVNGSTLCARSGGFVGYSYKDTFIGGINAAFVGADESQVGGFTGESKYSTFTNCINVGTVAHIDRDDFTGSRFDRNKILADYEFSPQDFGWLIGGSVSGGLFLSTVISMVASENSSLFMSMIIKALYGGWAEMSFLPRNALYTLYDVTMYLPEFASFCTGTTVFLVVVAAAIAVSIELAGGDDEVGGISGLAVGGSFEQCQNYVPLRCRDDNLGGIVGLGQGVTINNCFNSASLERDEDDTTGTILGKAEPNPEEGGKKCKVTNCLSTDAYHIVGDEGYDDGMDPTSGNNYRPDREKYNGAPVDCEYAVKRSLIESDLVAYWLNQGIENRSIGAKPWRKGITENIGKRNVLDPTLPEVTIDDLDPFIINSSDDLIAYSKEVETNQFRCGKLNSNITLLTSEKFTPIGKNEENKQFRGIFDGCGHTISGLDYSSSDQSVGLFGSVHSGAEIRNVNVYGNLTCEGDAGAGGIVGSVNIDETWGNVIIENCFSGVNINVNKNGGGILGRVIALDDEGGVNVYVDSCYSTGTITAKNGNSALLCGYAKKSGRISNSWSTGQLRTSQSEVKPFSVENDKGEYEYLVGYANKNINIKNCYALACKANIDLYDASKTQDGVTEVDDVMLAHGELTYMLNGNTNDPSKPLIWEQLLNFDEHPCKGTRGVFAHYGLKENKIGTTYLPYEVKSDECVKFFTFAGTDTEDGTVKLKFEYAEKVPAATPALYLGHDERIYDVLSASGVLVRLADEDYTNNSGWQFVGSSAESSIDDEDVTKHIYYVSDNKIRNAKKVNISPFHAFFYGPSIEELKEQLGGDQTESRVRIVIEDEDGETSSIPLINSELAPSFSNTKTYSLMGTEVNNSYRGIVIRNGKKELIK